MCEQCAAALEHAFEVGQWATRLHEAQRCLVIFSEPLAQKRPVAVWNLLPLGLPLDVTLGLAEDDDDEPLADEVWAYHHELLSKRITELELLHESWKHRNDTKH